MSAAMHVFVWKSTGPVSVNYHDGGGLVVVAPTIERAREVWELSWAEIRGGSYGSEGLPERSGAADADPDHVWPLIGGAETVIVFEDAGCC